MSALMVQRAARAMCAADSGPQGSTLFDIHWAEFGGGYHASARIGIAAMRWADAWDEDLLIKVCGSTGVEIVTLSEAWDAMLDGALAEDAAAQDQAA